MLCQDITDCLRLSRVTCNKDPVVCTSRNIVLVSSTYLMLSMHAHKYSCQPSRFGWDSPGILPAVPVVSRLESLCRNLTNNYNVYI